MEPSPDLAVLIDLIAEDPELMRQLSAEQTVAEFATLCSAAATARGLQVTPVEIQNLIRFHGIRWLERNAR